MLRNATFLPGNQDQFLSELQVPYGYIVVDGCEPLEMTNLAHATDSLKGAVEDRLIDADTAQRLEDKMTEAGLLINIRAVCEQGRQIKMPNGINPILSFKACTACGEVDELLPHGSIMTSTDKVWGYPVLNLNNGFAQCRTLFGSDIVRLFDVAPLLQQMCDMDLAADEAERTERWGKVPEATRREVTQARNAKRREQLGPFANLIRIFED